MGKNKKKINSVFKVAGAKSLKLKAKAKAVKTNLKNINTKNKDKVTELNKQFVEVQHQMIQNKSQKKDEQKPNTRQLPSARDKEQIIKQKSQETIQDLDKMSL